MTWIDWLILVAYAAATIGLGWYFSRKQRTTKEYFTGTGRMNPILIGVSLFATLLSTTSYYHSASTFFLLRRRSCSRLRAAWHSLATRFLSIRQLLHATISSSSQCRRSSK